MIRLLKTLPLLALTGAMGLAGVARAEAKGEGDHRLQQAFGSTIVSTYPDGRQAELWLKRDGSYTAEGRRHDRSSGTWQVKDDKGGAKLCLKQHAPFPAPFSYCTGVPEGGLDKPWTGKAYTGEQIRIKLMRGIVDPAKDGGGKAEATRGNNDG
jgi:hypothetical protein